MFNLYACVIIRYWHKELQFGLPQFQVMFSFTQKRDETTENHYGTPWIYLVNIPSATLKMAKTSEIVGCERCRQLISVSEAEAGFKDALSSSLVLIIPALETVRLSQQDQLRHNELSYLEQVFVLKCTSCDK
ncbi:hypothetical protein Ocin01_16609, partial [Orchesella cincta]